jgi:hypothetical protein
MPLIRRVVNLGRPTDRLHIAINCEHTRGFNFRVPTAAMPVRGARTFYPPEVFALLDSNPGHSRKSSATVHRHSPASQLLSAEAPFGISMQLCSMSCMHARMAYAW